MTPTADAPCAERGGMDAGRSAAWEAILGQTREMLQAADAGDWERVTVLEQERRAGLARFFAEVPARHEVSRVRAGIQEIEALDGRLLVLCRAGRAQAAADVTDLRRKAAAGRAYARTAER